MKKIKVIDIITIFIQVTYWVSLVKVVTLDLLGINSTVTLTALMLMLHYKRFNFCFTNLNKLIKSSFLIILFFFVYLFDVLQCLFRDPASALIRFLACANTFLFFSYLLNLQRELKCSRLQALQVISKPYLLFAIYNVVIVLIAAILIFLGIISITENELPINSITKTDVESGQIYYFPKYICIVTQSMRIFSNMGIPMLTGLTHEPHVFNYLVMPALFILFSFEKIKRYRFYLYILFAIASLFATSTTAFICFGTMFLLDLLWSFVINKNFSNLLLMLLLVLVIMNSDIVIQMMVDEFMRKTEDSTGSMNYSTNIINYLLTPNSLFGEGNMPAKFGYSMTGGNVGFITFTLDILFLVTFIYQAFVISINRKIEYHYFGLACLYIMLHSFKCFILIFNYPLFAFFVLANALLYNELRCKDNISKYR